MVKSSKEASSFDDVRVSVLAVGILLFIKNISITNKIRAKTKMLIAMIIFLDLMGTFYHKDHP